jgi:HlyD family secretion protein
LDLVNKQISDSFLKAPIEGRIVKDNFERGEQVSPGQAVFSLLGKNNYEIDVDISESDIAKLKVGDEAEVTLDAFGDDRVFKAVVDFIEPAETVIQDVVYYKVSLKFSDEAERLSDVKPGMTANVTIITAKRENVLVIPERAISEKSGGEKYVRVLRDGQVVESPVKTGLKGDGGSVEVISGVGAGDEVVVFIKPKK